MLSSLRRKRFSGALGLLLVLSVCGSSQAQTVTFKSYPLQAEVWVGTGSKGGFTPLGESGRPLDLSNRYQASVLILEFRAEGRKSKSLTVAKGLLKDGVYPETIYLHPTNPVLYPVDAVRLYPYAFLVFGIVMVFLGIRYRRLSDSQKKVMTEDEAFVSLGANMRRKFGRYIAYRELGRGGMGVVFYAVPEDSLKKESIVAIKALGKVVSDAEAADLSRKPEAPTEESIARFRRETKILKDMRHRNVLNLVDWGVEDEIPFIVTELLEGQEFQEYLESQGPLPLNEVVDKFGQLADGMQYVHDKGVLHRDLKPQNIFLTKEGTLKILDFGLARSDHQTRALTTPGVPMGTLNFMAPEALLGNDADQKFDQFALGAIVYQMLAGKLPMEAQFTQDGAFRNFHQLAATERPSLKTHCPELASEVIRVIDRMLQIEPKERFDSIREAFEAFAKAAKKPVTEPCT